MVRQIQGDALLRSHAPHLHFQHDREVLQHLKFSMFSLYGYSIHTPWNRIKMGNFLPCLLRVPICRLPVNWNSELAQALPLQPLYGNCNTGILYL